MMFNNKGSKPGFSSVNKKKVSQDKDVKKKSSKDVKDEEIEDLRTQRESEFEGVENIVDSADAVDDIPDMLDFLEVTSGLVAGGGAPGLDALMAGVMENDFVVGEISQETVECSYNEGCRREPQDNDKRKVRAEDAVDDEHNGRRQEYEPMTPSVNFKKRK